MRSSDALKNTDAKRLVTDVLGDFSIRFIAQYKNEVVKKVMFESLSAAEDICIEKKLLMKCPKPSFDLKRGLIYKRSVWRKKFQERVLVVHNEAQNYHIEYYVPSVSDGEVHAGKLKGSLSFVGCTVDLVDAAHPEYSHFSEGSATKENFGIIVYSPKKLIPTFYFKVSNLEEQLEWFKVLTIACQRTTHYCTQQQLAAATRQVFPITPKRQIFTTVITPHTVDDLSVSAFQLAYRDIRLRYGLSGGTKVQLSLNEVEMLGILTMDILQFEVNICHQLGLGRDIHTATSTARRLSEGDSTDGPSKSALRRSGSFNFNHESPDNVNLALPNTLSKGFNTDVQKTWAGCQSTARYMRDSLSSSARNLIEHVKDYKSQMKESILDSIDVLVHPYMKQASIQIFRPLVEVTSEGFAQALVFAIRDIHRLLVWMSTPSELPYGELSYRPSDQTSVVEGARYVSASRSRSAISLAHFLHTDVPYDDLFNDEQKQSGFPMLEGYTYQLRQSIQISHLTFFHSHSPMGLCYDRRSMEFGLGVQEVHPERLDGQDDHEHGNGDPAQPGSVDEKSTEESKVPTSLESRTKATHSILHHASAPSSIEAPSMSAFLSHFTPTDQTFNPPSTRCATTPSATDPSPTSDIFCASTSAVHAPSDMQEPLLLGIKSEAVVELLQHEIQELCHSALNAFLMHMKTEGAGGVPLSMVPEIIGRMMHDAVELHHEVLVTLLHEALRLGVEESLRMPSIDLVSPIRDMINAVPVAGVPGLLDLESLLDEVIEDIEMKYISEDVAIASTHISRQMDALSSTLGISYSAVEGVL